MASKIRQRLLTAATESFAGHGYHGVSTKQIAELADVTEGSLFRIFRSKKALFTEAAALAIIDACKSPSSKKATESLRLVSFALLVFPKIARKKIKQALAECSSKERREFEKRFTEFWLRGILK